MGVRTMAVITMIMVSPWYNMIVITVPWYNYDNEHPPMAIRLIVFV